MTDATKLTFKSPVVVSIILGAIGMTTGLLKSNFETNSKIDKLSAKFDVYIAQSISDKVIINYRLDKLDKVAEQVEVNTLTIKTIADFIEPKKIEITKRRQWK